MKTMDFSETIAASKLKIGRNRRQLIEFMKAYEYLRLGSFLVLAQGHFHMKLKICFSQKPLGQT